MYLFCFARLGAKAIDKLLDVGDLGLLFRGCSLLAFEFFATQSLESRVVAAINVGIFARQMQNTIDGVVQKSAIVGDDQKRALKLEQPTLQPQYGLQIEVIGRLVQEQYIGRRHQCLRQI